MRILLLGASGFVGGALWARLRERHEVVGTSSRRAVPGLVPLELRDPVAVGALVADGFDLVVHAAGMVDLGAAEAAPDTARAVNVTPLELLGRIVPARTRIVFLSSDNVFDGTRPVRTERDEPAPANVYGRTKLAGEAVVLRDPRHLVLRIPLVFGRSPWSEKFLDRFASPTTRAQTDVVCAPVYLPALAADLERLWELTGVVHYGGAEVVTRYQLMRRVATALRLPTEVVPVTEDEMPGGVRRPRHLVLRSVRHRMTGPDLDTALGHLTGAP